MKDTLMQKVTPMYSCLADCADPSVTSLAEVSPSNLIPNDSYCRVRRSATMIGLAISMSATGLLLTQNKAAVAANSLTANVDLPSLPTVFKGKVSRAGAMEFDGSQLAPLALKHKIKVGESIEQLAQDYHVEAEAIATINKLSVKAGLVPGQTLKIPTLEKSAPHSQPKQSKVELPKSQELASKSLNTSLDHLRETRKRLQDSLGELKTDKSKPKSEATSLVADVSDVSQPLKPIATQSQVNQELQGISIPVLTLESESASFTIPNPNQSSDITPSVEPRLTKVETTQITAVITNQNAASKLPALAKLPSVPEAKVEGSALPQFKEPVAIPVPAPENNNSLTNPEIPSYSSNPKPLKVPKQRDFAPEATTQQARIVPKPRLTTPVTKRFYQVRPGDTLNSIARRHGLTLSELIRANGINNPNLIKVNQSLIIPQKGVTARSQLQPRKIANIPQSGNLVAASPDKLSRSSLRVPVTALSSQSTAKPSGTQKNFARQNQAEPIEISVTPDPGSYTEKLKADIANLEQEYAAKPEQASIEIQPNSRSNSTKPVVGQTLNNEWATDRQKQPGTRRIAQRVPHSRLVGAAPSNTQQYNDAFRIPVGTNVGPELPPLSSPENYLPNAPMKFTGHIWPTKGVLTSGYGRRWGRMHKGIDIAAPIGTPIIATAPGEVITAGWNSGGYGKLVKVRHPDGSLTLYAHNSRLLVRRGQKVEQGQQIAEMGSTGYSTGPHLHFEVHPKGRGAVNPIAMLPKKRN